MSVIFEDFHIEVEAALNEGVITGLYKAASVIKRQVETTSRADKGHLRGSWECAVDESALTAKIGSPLENSIWEEFGTGEYATEGKGRSGYWVFVKDGSDNTEKKVGKRYSLEKAKQIVAIMKSKGLDAYYTKGKTPSHALQKSFDSKKNTAKRVIEKSIKDAMK